MTSIAPQYTHRLAGCSMQLLLSDNTLDFDQRHQNSSDPIDPRHDADELPRDVVAFTYMSTMPIIFTDGRVIGSRNEMGWYLSQRFFIEDRVTIMGSDAAKEQRKRRRDAAQLALLLEDPKCRFVALFGRGQYHPFCPDSDELLTLQYVEPD